MKMVAGLFFVTQNEKANENRIYNIEYQRQFLSFHSDPQTIYSLMMTLPESPQLSSAGLFDFMAQSSLLPSSFSFSRKLQLKASEIQQATKPVLGRLKEKNQTSQNKWRNILTSIISFFSYIIARLLSLQLLMSFSNYAAVFYPAPIYLQFPLLPFPYPSYTLDTPSASVKVQQNSFPTSEQKSFYSRPEVDLKAIEQNLRKLHFATQHHRKCHWTQEQDKLLEKLVQVQKLEWKQIPNHFTQRTQNMCYSRYRRISMSTKDRLWTKDEEARVIDLVNKFGEKWKLISNKLSKYTPKQIRERYLNYLRDSIVRQEFDFEEDLKICKYVLEKGKHWRKMEEELQGRSEGCIKGRYYGKLQKIIEQCRTSAQK